MSNKRKIKGEQNLIYNLTIWGKHDHVFDILNGISENVTLVQCVVVNSMADDVWGSEYELTGVLSDKVDSWD